jgi:hypothetical protein
MANQNLKKSRKKEEDDIPVNEKDPTIRQEFPGAANNKKKIEAGIRNVKDGAPAAPGNKPVPPATSDEPVKEKSDDVKT